MRNILNNILINNFKQFYLKGLNNIKNKLWVHQQLLIRNRVK
jgi:hypothetical protein